MFFTPAGVGTLQRSVYYVLEKIDKPPLWGNHRGHATRQFKHVTTFVRDKIMLRFQTKKRLDIRRAERNSLGAAERSVRFQSGLLYIN